jgi:hypothetical protein
MRKNSSPKEVLLAKLEKPLHISYISKYILRRSEEDSIVVINELIQDNILEESKYGKGYYVRTKGNG